MSVDLKLLGGLFRFRYINDIEDMDLEVLQEMYVELEEEYLDSGKDCEELKGELDKLKEVIEKKSQGEKSEKKKSKTAKDVLGDEDIPYEVRMKYIIDAYRKDQKKWEKLLVYAKHLEVEVIRLKNILIANGYADTGNPDDSKPAKVINELKEEVDQLKKKLKEKKLKATNENVEKLKRLIEKEYPLRRFKLRWLKDTIREQKAYIEKLQEKLDENGIIYDPFEDVDENVLADIEKIDDSTVRLKDDLGNI